MAWRKQQPLLVVAAQESIYPARDPCVYESVGLLGLEVSRTRQLSPRAFPATKPLTGIWGRFGEITVAYERGIMQEVLGSYGGPIDIPWDDC